MANPKPNTLDYILYGSQEIEAKAAANTAPSSATMLVSLFLILITFFIVLNRNANPDAAKRKVVFENISQKFGRPDDELQSFGSIVPPKVEEFTIQLENILGNNARVETTVNGEKTKIIFAKEFFFYSDETELRGDKVEIAKKISTILKKLSGEKPTALSVIAESENFAIDSKKLEALKNAFGVEGTEIGISTIAGGNITLLINNE